MPSNAEHGKDRNLNSQILQFIGQIAAQTIETFIERFYHNRVVSGRSRNAVRLLLIQYHSIFARYLPLRFQTCLFLRVHMKFENIDGHPEICSFSRIWIAGEFHLGRHQSREILS